MKVVIVKYNAGNIRSVYHALGRLGINAEITGNHEVIKAADKVIFPGVGEARTTMRYLKQHGLDMLLKSLTQPVLGICLGMQLMCSHSEENDVDCLGIFEEKVKRFTPEKAMVNITKVPHMGWNTLEVRDGSFIPISLNGQFVYFVHSYYVESSENSASQTNYIIPFSSALQKNNFYATQFHPEKSGTVGEQILTAFLGI